MFDIIYKEKDEFCGKSNNFNFKVIIFYDKYRYIGLLKNIYIYNASIILFGQF